MRGINIALAAAIEVRSLVRCSFSESLDAFNKRFELYELDDFKK